MRESVPYKDFCLIRKVIRTVEAFIIAIDECGNFHSKMDGLVEIFNILHPIALNKKIRGTAALEPELPLASQSSCSVF